MMTQYRKHVRGFTLIEVLMVLAIIAAILYMSMGYLQRKTLQMRVDRTSLQMQQILNAGLSYYVAQGKWPVAGNTSENITNTTATNALQTNGYLPAVKITSPFGTSYFDYTDAKGTLFTVYTSVTAVSSTTVAGTAAMIAGTLPLSFTSKTAPPTAPASCTAADKTCYVIASVNIPGQNLNNASAVNFAGLYRQGACVPVPQCPVDSKTGSTMVPQIFVVPNSVAGLNDPGSNNVYPISSFTAGTSGPPKAQPDPCPDPVATVTPDCTKNLAGPPASAYWRVCLDVYTDKNVRESNTSATNPLTDFGNTVSMLAFTRCGTSTESAGTNSFKMNYYGN